MTIATGRLFGWDRRDSDTQEGPTYEGPTEFITGPYEELTLPNPFGVPTKRYFINGYDVEPGTVTILLVAVAAVRARPDFPKSDDIGRQEPSKGTP
jgi:hypothetical protein